MQFPSDGPVAKRQHERNNYISNRHNGQKPPRPAVSGLVKNHTINPGFDYGRNQDKHQYGGHNSENKKRRYIVRIKIGTVHIFSFRLILKVKLFCWIVYPLYGHLKSEIRKIPGGQKGR
jgi:hypothetical protein